MKTFKEWFKEDDHDLFNFPEEAMQEAWNAAITASIESIENCELVEPNVYRIRKHEATGSLIQLYDNNSMILNRGIDE